MPVTCCWLNGVRWARVWLRADRRHAKLRDVRLTGEPPPVPSSQRSFLGMLAFGLSKPVPTNCESRKRSHLLGRRCKRRKRLQSLPRYIGTRGYLWRHRPLLLVACSGSPRRMPPSAGCFTGRGGCRRRWSGLAAVPVATVETTTTTTDRGPGWLYHQ